MKQDIPLSLVSKGANFDVLHQGERIGALQYGLHLGDYGIVIQSGNVIYCYSVSRSAAAIVNPKLVLDELLGAFKQKQIAHRVLFEGNVECAQRGTYLVLLVDRQALMWLSLHPVTDFPGCSIFTSTDSATPHEYYVYPVAAQLSYPDLNLTVLHHSMGWCHNRF